MLTNILEFFLEKKEEFVKTNVSREHYMPAYVDSDSGTYWPSQWDEVKVDEIDWEAFEQTVKELEEAFREGGSTYILYKSSERMSAIMASTFASFEEQLKGNDGTIEVIDSGDYVNNSKGANE